MTQPIEPVVVITGAGKGLGGHIAQAFLNAGFRVALTDRDLQAVKDTAQAIDPEASRTLALALDVTEKAQFIEVLDCVKNTWGTVQAFVNNAALTLTTAPMDITAEEFDQVIAVNLRGPFFGCQVFGQYFADQGYGRIINIASLAGQNGGTAAGAHYASAKGGVLTMTKIFARQLAEQGVTVNAVAPGPLDLPIVREAVPEEKLNAIINSIIPVKALGNPAWVAQTVLHLARPESGFITGAAWDINGGIFMR
ncbi:MAG: SDR family oxidoreductase [Saccharospirillum sp.]|nr:SDR family oxidoreductase [Saccharospirillum sp.]